MVLEKFVEAVPKGQRVTAGLGAAPEYDDDGSSISLDDASHLSSIKGDTVSAKDGDTLASSRSKVIRGKGLSASDSGRLVNVQRRAIEFDEDDSKVDLQAESGYKGAETKASGDSSGRYEVPRASAGRSSVHIGDESDVYRNRQGSQSRINGRKPMDPVLLGALILTLVIVAGAIGFMAAVLTR